LIITLQDRTAKMYDAESMLIDTAQEMILFSNTLFRTRKKNWKPEEFRQETFFVLADDREEMQLDCVRAIGSKYGFVPNICSVNSMESILMNVENGLGVTVCNSWVRNVYEPGFQCCPLEHSTEIAAAWKQGQENSALQILLGYMTEKNLNSCKISA
jgi:DNA-binding transcriptional LysR family regulator